MAHDVNVDAIAADYQTLVLEGCDGVGKSTLATNLSRSQGFTVVHSPKTPDHLDLADRYRTILAQPGRLLFDRCFLSELVYGPLHRGRSRITWAQAVDLAESVTARRGLIIHLTAPAAVVHQRLVERDGFATSVDDIAALITGYHRVFSALADYTNVLTMDTSAAELDTTG